MSVSESLIASVYAGEARVGEHHMPVQIIFGEGPDEGTACMQIGEVCIWFSSIDTLVDRLTTPKDRRQLMVVG